MVKFQSIALAAMMAVGAPAQAATVDWGTHDVLVESAATLVPFGSFTDYFLFTIDPQQIVNSTAVANNLGGGFILNIANGRFSLWSDAGPPGSGGSDLQLSPEWTFDGTTGNVTNSVTLLPGSYYYKVSGSATGLAGGLYTLTSTIAPIPEPSIYAMFAAGLGAIGFVVVRRRRQGM